MDWKQGFGQDGKINKNVIMKARIGKKRSVNVLFYWLEYKIYQNEILNGNKWAD